MAKPKIAVEIRFWQYVEPDPNSGCWLWSGAPNHSGYGQINAGGNPAKRLMAHRLSWEMHHGTIPKGLHVCHRCDTPACVNPRHLFVGTPQNNIDDMMNKGRHRTVALPGEAHGMSVLTDVDVIEIRRLYSSSRISQQEIADRFGVERSTIGYIVRGKHWKHLL